MKPLWERPNGGRGGNLVLPKNNVCEPEPENDFCDVGIRSQSQLSSNKPRTNARGIRCEEHSSFILSWNLIGQGETKVITSQKSFPGSGSQTLFFGRTKWQPEIRLLSQAQWIQALALSAVVWNIRTYNKRDLDRYRINIEGRIQIYYKLSFCFKKTFGGKKHV